MIVRDGLFEGMVSVGLTVLLGGGTVVSDVQIGRGCGWIGFDVGEDKVSGCVCS